MLFGRGRRLFEVLPSRVELENVRVMDTPGHTNPLSHSSLSRSTIGLAAIVLLICIVLGILTFNEL